MSDYELNRAIHHIYTDRERTEAFRRADYAVLEHFTLTGEERRALSERDFRALGAACPSGAAVPPLGGAQPARMVSRERRAEDQKRVE